MFSGALETFSPVIITFTASDYYPANGASTTLSWNVTNAASVASSFMGQVNPSGSTTISSSGTVSYTLTATGLDGLTYTSSLSVIWQEVYCPERHRNWGWC